MKRSFLQRTLNRVLHFLARILPGSTTVRPFLHKLRGVHITGKVFIGDDVYLENEYPECVEIHDGASIGLRSIIIAHTRGAGRIVIGKDAAIGSGSIVTCSSGAMLEIGEGAVICAGSVVTNNIPSFTCCGAPRIQAYAKVTVPLTLDIPYKDFLRGLRPIKSAAPVAPRREVAAVGTPSRRTCQQAA